MGLIKLIFDRELSAFIRNMKALVTKLNLPNTYLFKHKLQEKNLDFLETLGFKLAVMYSFLLPILFSLNFNTIDKKYNSYQWQFVLLLIKRYVLCQRLVSLSLFKGFS